MADLRNVRDIVGTGKPRMLTYSFDSTIVYDKAQAGGAAQVGLAVKYVGDGQVALTTDASEVTGKLVRVEPDVCTVQVGGGCTLPAGAAAAITAGSKIVGAVGGAGARGYIRNVAVATLAEVAVANHKIYSAAVSTAVQVDLAAGG